VTRPLAVVRGTASIADAFASARTVWPEVATLTWWTIDRPTLVLGSAQSRSVIDARAVAASGVDVVQRASGGGAVLLRPDDVLWGDVVLPPTDPRWSDDVVAASNWVGEAWCRALVACDLPADELTVHHGGLVRTAWSDLVCFAGLGPGEVSRAGRKVVGISQRRGRSGARFQMAVLRRWDPVGILDLLAVAPDARTAAIAALRVAAAAVPATAMALEDAFAAEIG
jgi:lipoate---protein ligase